MNSKKSATKQEQIQVGAQTITYTLTFAPRKSVGITIRPDMSVAVRAPQSMSRQEVAGIMRQRASWVLRHLQKFAQRTTQPPPSAKPTEGAYPFLGQQIPLQRLPVTALKSAKEQVKLENGVLYIWVKEIENETRVAALLDKWLREQAEIVFFSRLLLLYVKFKGLSVELPELTIRRMKARWGSCSVNGVVTLNLKLIHLDQSLIDYVIMHELCHLIEHNHSKRFYALLGRMMPDWSERRQRLNEIGMPE